MEFINQYLNKKKLSQEIILDYIDDESNQDDLSKIASYFENEKIQENKKDFLDFLKMIATISKNHHHSTDFYHKIEQIISLLKNDIPKVLSNIEVFNIFKNSIRILLFLLNEKIVVLDKEIANILRSKYSVYFYPEIKEFEAMHKTIDIMQNIKYTYDEYDDDSSSSRNIIENYNNSDDDYFDPIRHEIEDKDDISYNNLRVFTKKEEIDDIDDLDTLNQKEEIKNIDDLDTLNQKEEIEDIDDLDTFNQKEEKENKNDIFDNDIETFKQKRLIGENDDALCQLVRNDRINDFISYVNQNGIKIDSKISSSDFETNSFLRKNSPTIIEYVAFFGSINIFKYLIINKCKIKPSIWLYSIHGKNSEIIHILEEKEIKPKNNSFLDCFYESLKCHHTDLSNYLSENYITDIDKKSQHIIFLCMKLNNFNAIQYLFESKFTNYKFLNHIGFINICLHYDYINLVEFLLKQDKININKRTTIIIENKNTKTENYESVIHIALDKGNNELLKLILSNPKIDVNQTRTTKSITKEKINNNYYHINYYNIINRIRNRENEEEEENDEKIQEKIKYTKEDTVLNNALTNGNLEIVKLLLEKQNINPNIKTIIKKEYDTEEYVALNIAIENEYWDIARILITIKGIDVNLKSKINKNVKTPLSISVAKNNMEFVKELLSKTKIDVNQSVQCSGYRYKQYQKIYYHDMDEFDDYMFDDNDEYYYHDHEPQEANQEKNLLYIAIEKNDIDLIKLLLARQDINVNILTNEGSSSFFGENDKETPLFAAVKTQNLEVVQMLLAHPKIDVNKKSILSGSYSERYGRINSIGSIRTEKNPLYLAIENRYTEIVRLLLNNKNINLNEKFTYKEMKEEEKTILHVAIESRDAEIVHLLLEQKNIDVNAKKSDSFKGEFGHITESHKTPLFLAVEIGNAKIVKYLLERKDLQINEKSIFTRKGYTKYVEFVVNYEGDKDAMPVEKEDFREEKTVLQLAIERRNSEIVSLLLSQPDIDVNERITLTNIIDDLETRRKTQNNTSTTALHIAVINKDLEIIKLLLSHKKINVNAFDDQHKRPIDLARDSVIKDLFKK